MPYIPMSDRVLIDSGQLPNSVGELTYLISATLERYRQSKIAIAGRDRYQDLAECVVACEQAADEFRRQVIHPFEDAKMADTGSVHGVPIREQVGPRTALEVAMRGAGVVRPPGS